MIGAFLNTATILTGGTLGLLLGTRLPERAQRGIMRALGVATFYIGGKMTWDACCEFDGRAWLILVIALLSGIALGTWLRIQHRLEDAAQRLLARFSKEGESSRIAQGFISTTLLFCVGPMTILGSIRDGLTGDYWLIAVKSGLDGVASIGFAATFGWGVLLSAVSVLLVQGSLTLGAGALSGVFTPPLVAQLSAAGGVLVICIAITLTGLRKLPVADYLPAILIAPLIERVFAAH